MAQDRGFTQVSLMRKSGVSYTTIHNYWHNKVRTVSLTHLEAIGVALGVSGTNLLTDLPLLKHVPPK